MKRIILSLLLLSFISVGFAQKGRVYVVKDFSQIAVSLPVNIQITLADKFEVKSVGTSNDIEQIVVEMSGNTLFLKSESGRHNFDKNTTVYITLPTVERISQSGSGNISVAGVARCQNLDINLAGSGEILLSAINVENFSVTLSGSGNVRVSEKSEASKLRLRIAGSGNLMFATISASDVDVNIAGSGNATVRASESLSVRIAGSGNVDCSGNPKKLDKVVFGSGRVSIQ
jgi:Protein of unknown function (DUF2807).